MARTQFFLDPGSPWCWLVAEHVNAVIEPVPEWVPVVGDAVGKGNEGGTEAGMAGAQRTAIDRVDFERRASDLGLPTVRWPDPFPFPSDTAALAATFAKQSGRVVAFSLAAMRQAFAAGRDLSDVDNVLLAAAACELHPRAVLKGIESRAVAQALEGANAAAAAQGVSVVPAIVDEDGVVQGRDCLALLESRMHSPEGR